jgi:hypothetical protein
VSDQSGCAELQQLLDCYTATLTTFRKSEKLFDRILPNDLRYAEARRIKNRASDLVVRARNLYLEHVAQHKCVSLRDPVESPLPDGPFFH